MLRCLPHHVIRPSAADPRYLFDDWPGISAEPPCLSGIVAPTLAERGVVQGSRQHSQRLGCSRIKLCRTCKRMGHSFCPRSHSSPGLLSPLTPTLRVARLFTVGGRLCTRLSRTHRSALAIPSIDDRRDDGDRSQNQACLCGGCGHERSCPPRQHRSVAIPEDSRYPWTTLGADLAALARPAYHQG